MKRVYPAIFTPEGDGQYNVMFPDLPSCYTFGNDIADAIDMARDAASMWLCHSEDHNEQIPPPSDLNTLQPPSDGFINLIDIDTHAYRRENDNRAVKKTLSIPNWLNTQAERAGVNFSQTLQEALKEKLNIQDSL